MRKKGRRSKQIRFFLIFGFILTTILIFVVSTVGRRNFNAGHKIALEIIGIGQSAATAVDNYFKGLWNDYVELWNVRNENGVLRAELEKCQADNNEYREAVALNVRLKKLLDLKENLPPPTLTAEIIGRSPSRWFKTVIINRGSKSGVEEGMPAVTVEGIVGQIMNTSPSFSKVLLANDPNSAIDVLIQKNRVQGIIKGDGGDGFKLEYILKNAGVEQGDTIVTSGLGGIFPKGLPVGTISKVVVTRRGMFQHINIRPAVDFSRLEHVIIILRKNPLAE